MFDFDVTRLYIIPILLFAMAIHEYAHAAVADYYGDRTPAQMGRLTMNPLVHVDFLGLLMFFVAGFGWAKPVMVDTRQLRNPQKDMMVISLAGPVSNIVLAIIAAVLMALFSHLGMLNGLLRFFLINLQIYNIWFAVFNMFPFPPLDGFKVLTGLLSSKHTYSLYQKIAPIENYLPIVFIVLAVSGVIGKIVAPVADLLLTAINIPIYTLFNLIF